MNGKFLLITVLSLATLCLAGPAFKTGQDGLGNELNSIQDKINYEQKQFNNNNNNNNNNIKANYKQGASNSNKVEDILARWCQSSADKSMPAEILTESFKQLTGSLKQASKRQLEQLTDEIIISGRFCQQHQSQSQTQSQTQTGSESFDQYESEAQQEYIKDVYLDALVACDSSEAVEQLVRAIDSGKVDKIRSNYYLTLLAITTTTSDSSDFSTSTSDMAQKLSQSFARATQTGSGNNNNNNNNNKLIEAIERQKMFAATAAWSKKLERQQEQHQQQQGTTYRVPAIYKQQVEQLVEAIFERYIWSPNTKVSSGNGSGSQKSMAERQAALKALANIPCYAMPARQVDYLVQLALNKQEQTSARQSAIEALTDCSPEQAPQLDEQLKQLALYQTEEPIEVRIAAYRHIATVSHDKHQQQQSKFVAHLDELVKFIKEEQRERQDTQFVAYVVSHLTNLVKPSKTGTGNNNKSLYEEIKASQPQLLAQIRVVAKRMENAGYADMRKYSRNYQLEQSLARMDTGLMLDADVIYSKHELLPKVLRLNVSMPVNGKQDVVELVEITVRQSRMEREFLHVLKPLQQSGAKVNMDTLENVVSGFKKVAAASQQQQQQQQSNQNQKQYEQQAEADLAIKVDGCTVVYVSLDDFKLEQNQKQKQKQNEKQNIRSPRSISGSGRFHQTGSKHYDSLEEVSIVEQLLELLKKNQIVNRGLHFHMERRLGGLIDLQTVLTGSVRAQSRVRSLGRTQPNQAEVHELVARFEPRLAFETVWGLASKTGSGSGSKKLIQRVASESSLGLRVKYQEEQLLEVLLELPQQEEMELFKVESQLVEQIGTSASGLPIYRYAAGRLSPSKKQNVVDYYGNQVGDTTDDGDDYNKQTYTKVMELPQAISKLTGMRGKFEIVTAPKHLSGMMRLVVKKTDPKMTGYRMLIQSDSPTGSGSGNSGKYQNGAYTIALSTPIQYGQEQQQERLVQLRFIRAETSEMSSIKGELVTPMSEPMRFMLAYKDDGRQQALEWQFKCGKSEGGKFEIGYQKPASQQMSKRSDQYIYKPYLRVQMADRQPIEMSALVQVVRTPKTSVQYEIQVPQEFVSLIGAGGYRAQKRQVNQENKIKGKLTLVANSNNNKWTSSKARRDMKSGSEQLINMIDSTDVVMTNDLDVQVGRVSLKALTHFGFKPQDQHLVMSNNVDYAIVESGTSDKVDQSRFDLELKNQDEHEDQQQIVYINHSSSKYPQTDFTVKFAHKQTGKKHQLLARYQYPTRAYERMIKTSHKLLSMEERLNEMGRIEYSHELEYYNVKQMQLIAQLFVSPLKFERKIQFQIQSERQQTGARIATKANSNNDDQSIKAQIVIVDKVSQREDLNAYVKFDKIQSQQQIKQYNVQMKAELDNKKHQIEVRHDCQHQVSDKLVKNMFRMSVDKQTTTTFDYQIRQQQQAGSGKFDYLLEGQWRDAQTSQRPVQVRSRTQFSMVEGFEFEHQFECPEKQMSSVIVLSEPKKLAKIEMKSIDFQLSHTNDYKLKQMQLAVQYRPARFQHQTRVQYDSRQQVVVIESEQVKYERQQYRIKSQLASPIDLDYLGAQYERFYQSGSGTSKRPMSSKQQQKTGRYYEKKSQTIMTIGEMKKMIKLNKQPQPVSYIKGELAQQQVKFSLELVPQEERLQLVLADDLNAIYHKSLIETGSGSAKLVIKSETKTDKDSQQQQVYLIDAYVGEQEAKMKVLVPRLYNMEMDYDIERRKLVAYVKKGAKFERTLEASRNWWKNVERLVNLMDKMESQKVMIDAQQYPQIKVAYEMNESPVKKLVVFGADIWANNKHNPQSKWSSMAMQAGRYSGETKWQQQASEKLMRIQSELKDLYKKERYALQGELAHHTTNHKSYLNMDTPTLQGQWEYEPQEESAKLHLQGKQQNGAISASGSFKPFEFESRLERAPIGSTGRFVRRALVNYGDADEQHRHSFEFNPIGENVKLWSERKPIGTKYSTLKPGKHFWSMEANVNSHRRPWLSSGESYDRQTMEGKQLASTDFERSYLKMKHNNDLEAEFEMRPFAESVRTRKTKRNEQHDDDQQDQEQQQFARFAIKSRSPRSVYEHETSVSKDIKSGNYKAWMKHLSGAELKALFEAEIKSRKPSRGRYSKKSDEEDSDSEWSYDHEAKLQARSDKHGRAQWEHKWSGKSKKEPKVRDDKVSFDLDLSDKWNQFKHQSQFEMRRPFDWSSHGKRDRRSIYTQSDEPTFEYIKEKLSEMNPNKIDARMSTKTSYKSQPIYQIEADWNQMYNSNSNSNTNTKSQLTPRANQFKVNALQYKTEFEYQPMSHAHLQVIKPNQERHLVHYEHPIANVHRFNSRQVSPKGQDMYKFEAQVPTSFHQYEFHPFGQQQQMRTTRYKQPASTRIVYEDRQGKKMNLEFDLARQLRQKRASILLQDPKRGYEHHTKWAYTTASGLEADNISTKGKLLEPNYFKTETKSTRLGQLISFDIEARDSKQVLVRFDTPLVRGEISGERPQRHQQQLRVKLQNQQQVTQQQKSRLSKFIELPEQFYHDTELLINERDQYYKLKSQTVVDQQQLVELMLALNNAGGQQLGQFKLATRGSQVEIKLDQQLQRVDLHVDYDEKRLQQDTMIHLKDAQRQVYAIESITRYQQQPMLDIHGELCYDQVRCQEKKTKLEGQFASTSGEHQYKYQLAYDPMIKAAAMLISDPLRQEVHELQLSYDESKDAINANYVRKTTGNGTTNQVVLVRGEARLSMRDLMGKFYDVEYLDTRRRSTSQQAPMVSEIVLEVAPEWREQQRSFRISYEPKKSLELNYSDEPNKFQHHTRISFPLAASQKKDAYTQDFGLLMRQIRLESRQQYQNQLATYTTRVPIINYQLSFDYDLERDSQLKFDSPQTSLVFEVRPGDKFTKSGQLILASTRINHQSKFDFDLTTKRLMIKSSTKDKLAAINYEMEADLSGSRRQPSLVVIRSPKYHYRMESDILSGFPTLQMNLEQPDKMLRHEFLYRPMEGAYRRHQLKLASGRLAGQGAQSQWHSIDYSAPTSSLLDISFDRDNQQESYVRVASGQRDFYGQLQYQPSEESELRVKYGRPSEKFEHDTIVSHFNHQANYPRVFKSQATRQGKTLYQVYGDARLNKQSGNSRHALGYESHGYEVRATMDPRTHEISMEVTTPDNKRQRTELVMPSRLQPQYQVKSSLKTQEGVEIYSMESAYSGATRKMTIQYRQYQPNKQYQMEWDGKLKRGHIQSEHLQMEIKPTEALIKYQPTTNSQQVWTGVVRYALIKPTSGYKIATSSLLVVEAKFQKSTGEELHVDMERQLGHKAKVVVKVLNRQQKIDLIASAQADLLANTISMKVDYDQEKFEKFARQLIASADRHSNRHLYQFLQHQLVLEDGQQVSQYKVKEVGQLVEQVYRQVKEECARINHQRQYPASQKYSMGAYEKAKVTSCQLVEEYLQELEGAVVRTSDKFMVKLEQLYDQVPIVKQLVKVYDESRDLINKLIEHIIKAANNNNNNTNTNTNNTSNSNTKYSDDDQSYDTYNSNYVASVKSNATKLAKIILDPAMYQSHNSRFAMRPGYLAMELAPEKELNLIRGVMAY